MLLDHLLREVHDSVPQQLVSGIQVHHALCTEPNKPSLRLDFLVKFETLLDNLVKSSCSLKEPRTSRRLTLVRLYKEQRDSFRCCGDTSQRWSLPWSNFSPEKSSLACSYVLGKPSRTKPWFLQGLDINLSFTTFTSNWSSRSPGGGETSSRCRKIITKLILQVAAWNVWRV